MLRLFWVGTFVILVIGAAAFVLGPRYFGQGPTCDSSECAVAYDENYVLPEEPQPIGDPSADQPAAVSESQVIEVIDVLEAQMASLKSKESAAIDEGQKIVAPDLNVPVLLEETEKDYAVMPPCLDDDEALPALMPYAQDVEPTVPHGSSQISRYHDTPGNPKNAPASAAKSCLCCEHKNSSDAGVNEEQEANHIQNKLPGKSVAPGARLKESQLLSPADLKNDRVPSASHLDTMEFRPSDAKKGEFDPTPF
ncbi:MAG TPA: hypothetical protein VK395_04415 [Gemmataceae bacterium]|nr:hypothetical protein [Gemmataceae bacterium]